MTKTVVLVFSVRSSFIQCDIDLLKDIGCAVRCISSPPSFRIVPFLWSRIKELFAAIAYIPKSKVLICWFSDYHSFLPLLLARLMAKKSVVVVGGYDAVSLPQLKHGLFYKRGLRQKFRQKIAHWNYQLAEYIWVVHKSLREGCPSATAQNGVQAGLIHFLPRLQTPIIEVPTGYAPEYWITKSERTSKTVITVAHIPNLQRWHLKGIPLFIRLARAMPEFTFTLVGVSLKDRIPANLPANLRCLPPQTREELRLLYSQHVFYFQGSQVEGLPNVLCEAMLCGCIPVGNAVFGIPDVIGNTGFTFNGAQDLEAVITFMNSPNPNNGAPARERIIKHYSLERRKKALEQLMHTNTHSQP